MIICGGTRDVARNEAKEGLRTISEFAKLTSSTNVIVTCVPQRFDLQPTSCVNQEVIAFNRKLQKTLKTHSHVHVCNMSTTRNHFTYHGLHLNSQGKNQITNKWKPTLTSMTSKLTTVPTTTTTVTPLPQKEKSDNICEGQEHREVPTTTKGEKRIKEMHTVPKEQVFYNTLQPEAGKGSSDGEVPRKTL